MPEDKAEIMSFKEYIHFSYCNSSQLKILNEGRIVGRETGLKGIYIFDKNNQKELEIKLAKEKEFIKLFHSTKYNHIIWEIRHDSWATDYRIEIIKLIPKRKYEIIFKKY